MTPVATLLVLCVCVVFAESVPVQKRSDADSGKQAGTEFPSQLTDIHGQRIDVRRLAKDHSLVVITLKATWCQVCRRQIERIQTMLPRLKQCNVTFLVLSPGPVEDLLKIKQKLGFDYPFVADDDLTIARSLGLERPGNQIFPCMFEVLPNLHIGWRQLGRNGFYFGDGELKQYFDCTPV